MRVYRIPLSTNVERVAIGLGYKGLAVEWVDVPADDRSEVVRVSGQELVPVLDDDGLILTDSEAILRYLEEHHPEPQLWPSDVARRAEADIFVDWFNRLWKRAPNLIAAGRDPAKYGPRITAALDLFESMLDRTRLPARRVRDRGRDRVSVRQVRDRQEPRRRLELSPDPARLAADRRPAPSRGVDRPRG